MPENSARNSEELLQELLEKHKTEEWSLPPLQLQIDVPNWLKALNQAINDWLNRHIGKVQFAEDPSSILYWALVGLSIFIVLAFIWAVITQMRAIRRQRAELEGFHAATPAQSLEKMLNESLKARDYKAASRVRWLLYLKRMSLPFSTTPLEHAKAKGNFPPALLAYAAMFYPDSDPKKLFEDFSNSLDPWESTH